MWLVDPYTWDSQGGSVSHEFMICFRKLLVVFKVTLSSEGNQIAEKEQDIGQMETTEGTKGK